MTNPRGSTGERVIAGKEDRGAAEPEGNGLVKRPGTLRRTGEAVRSYQSNQTVAGRPAVCREISRISVTGPIFAAPGFDSVKRRIAPPSVPRMKIFSTVTLRVPPDGA